MLKELCQAVPMKHSAANHNLIKNAYLCVAVCLILFIVGCASPSPKPSQPSTASHSTETSANSNKPFKRSTPLKYSKGHQIVSIAESLVGSPYRYGGASPNGFDCSGLVYYTHQQLNITVPRTTKQQAHYRPSKQLRSAQPGDILFFRIYGSRVSHVGIYTGNDQFIHAPKSGKYVSYASLDEPYWRERLVKVATLH